jgi:hypothetical protein
VPPREAACRTVLKSGLWPFTALNSVLTQLGAIPNVFDNLTTPIVTSARANGHQTPTKTNSEGTTKGQVEGTPATFSALDQMLADSEPADLRSLRAEMLIYPHINGRNHSVVSASARDMMDRPANEAGSG